MLPRFALVALGVLAAAQALLFFRLPIVREYFYILAWWPYIILADGLVYSRSGWSLVKGRPAALFFLCVWSVTFWLIFEMFNLRLDNWRYVGIVSEQYLRWPGYALSFATVLPGIFLTYGIARSLGIARRVQTPRFPWTPNLRAVFVSAGVFCLVLPVLWPEYFFPLVWGGFFLLLDPLNDRLGGKSLLFELSRGRPQPILRLLLAGLVCGFLWEFWNYWAGAKWEYTIPFAGWLKLFEMPLLGFLGFPPFALECYAMYTFVACLGIALPWEKEPQPKSVGLSAYAAVVPQILFWLWAFGRIDRYTVGSFH